MASESQPPPFQPSPFQPPPLAAAVPPHQPDEAPSTSLKWGHNGELSPVDLQRVLERLTDPSLTRCQLEE